MLTLAGVLPYIVAPVNWPVLIWHETCFKYYESENFRTTAANQFVKGIEHDQYDRTS